MIFETLAPVVVFAYKRQDTLERTITALSENDLAQQTTLYVFSDGPRNVTDEEDIKSVRAYLDTIDGFKSIHIIKSEINKGLAQSIISGVSELFEKHEELIIVEDDVITSTNFLTFMNSALHFYRNNSSVFSISGWSIPIQINDDSDVYFTLRGNSSCWGMWKNRWELIDWKVIDYPQFAKNQREQKRFNAMGSDISSMLKRQMNGELDSWAIRWVYHQFKYNLYSVYPTKSKAKNIGYNSDKATHTSEKYSRFETILDTELKNEFHLPEEPKLEKKYLKQFLKPHSIIQRAKYKLMNKIFG